MSIALWAASGVLAVILFSSGVAKSVMSRERLLAATVSRPATGAYA